MVPGQLECVQTKKRELYNDYITISASIIDKTPRSLRGGSFDARPAYVRSALRGWNTPANRALDYGFRPSRTYH